MNSTKRRIEEEEDIYDIYWIFIISIMLQVNFATIFTNC
jgi:hypothetical protein